MNRQVTEGYKVVLFMMNVIALYTCQLSAGIFQEKIYKVPYPSNLSSGTSDVFTDNITPFSFTSAIACLIGYFLIKDEELTFDIPVAKLLKVAGSDLVIHITLIAGLLRTDYTTLIVVNSTSLLSVVLVGAFCSGVKQTFPNHEQREDVALDGQAEQRQANNDRIGHEKVWICLIVFLGVLIFSFNEPAKDATAEKPAGGALITFLLFAVAILLQGFKPDFVAQIKQEYKPSPLFLYFSINGIIAVLSLALSLCTWKISYFVKFIMDHDRLLIDLTIYGILNSMGALFMYHIISIFRQHIYPMVAELRRCLTICVNVAWYGHHLAKMQWMGILIVFAGIMVEIVSNYNLASRILPNDNFRNREGKNYKKIVPKEDGRSNRRYDIPDIGEDVEGI